jgi:hypothetical protein
MYISSICPWHRGTYIKDGSGLKALVKRGKISITRWDMAVTPNLYLRSALISTLVTVVDFIAKPNEGGKRWVKNPEKVLEIDNNLIRGQNRDRGHLHDPPNFRL